jgi:hypothetical protein
MTMERDNYNKIQFVCDECGEVEQTWTKDFDEALEVVKQMQWIARRDDDGWQHFCGDCK